MTRENAILAIAHVWEVPARHRDVPNAYLKAATEEGVEIVVHVPHSIEPDDDQLAALSVSSVREVGLRLERACTESSKLDGFGISCTVTHSSLLCIHNVSPTLGFSKRETSAV